MVNVWSLVALETLFRKGLLMTCKFPRFMMRITYSSAHISKANFIIVPMMDFREAWTDAKLYEFFDLDADEVALIPSIGIRP